ncbi:hypothetical protein [Anaerobiospirillum sp. NML120449]|uniref:hypothetical protein n=1 Tax=Anaerobiospirillum sp. NML120449 TaxID=2932817 RepID=UPI001FF3D20C|nr:hypothetical protein [Anaerobiospirillum sp. NML120449]MCK0525322.1 hypothetical protein [Anaerobiospirillum sp. NML120449]
MALSWILLKCLLIYWHVCRLFTRLNLQDKLPLQDAAAAHLFVLLEVADARAGSIISISVQVPERAGSSRAGGMLQLQGGCCMGLQKHVAVSCE